MKGDEARANEVQGGGIETRHDDINYRAPQAPKVGTINAPIIGFLSQTSLAYFHFGRYSSRLWVTSLRLSKPTTSEERLSLTRNLSLALRREEIMGGGIGRMLVHTVGGNQEESRKVAKAL